MRASNGEFVSIPKPQCLMEEPKFRPITLNMKIGGIGDALAFGPALEFCGRGHPKSEKHLRIPIRHHWIYKSNPFVSKLDAPLDHVHQPNVIYNNAKFLEDEMRELKAYGRVLSRTQRLVAMAGNSLVISRKPYQIKVPQEVDERICSEIQGPMIACSFKASNASRSYQFGEEVLALLRSNYPSYNFVDLDEMEEGKSKYSILEVVSIIANSSSVIAVDSAPAHIANSYGKRVLGLLGYTNVPGFLNYDNKKFFGISTDCPIEKHPCMWKIACHQGSFGQREKLPVECLRIEPGIVAGMFALVNTRVSKILVVMPTWNNLKHTRMAVESIDSVHDVDVFLVDNGSIDGSQQFFQTQGWNWVECKGSVAQALNVGLKKAVVGNYDFVILMNNDVVLSRDYIDELISVYNSVPDCGLVVGEAQEEGDRTWITEANTLKNWGRFSNLERGAYSATLIPVEAVRKVGLFDENFAPRYIEDNDYNIRLRLAGFQTIKTKSAIFFHDVGTTVKKIVGNEANRQEGYWERNKDYFKEKWGMDVHRDNHDNINFKKPFNGDVRKVLKYKIDETHGAVV